MMEQEILAALKEAYERTGVWGLVATLLMLSVRIYRTEAIQALVPSRAKWDNLPASFAKLLIFATATIGAMLGALLAGTSWAAALIAAIPIGLTAIGLHKGTQKAGDILDTKITPKIFRSSGLNPDYEPSPYRKAISLIVPLSGSLGGAIEPGKDGINYGSKPEQK